MLQLHEQKLQQRNLLVNFERISQFRFRRRLKTSFQKFTFLVDSVLRQCKNKMLTKGQCSNLSVNVNGSETSRLAGFVTVSIWKLLLSFITAFRYSFLSKPFFSISIFSYYSTLTLMEEATRKGSMKTRSSLELMKLSRGVVRGESLRWIFGRLPAF